MALRIYTGGTTGAQDGTLEVGGDGQGLTLGVGATGVQHLRCDEGEQTAESVVVNAPTGCQVSADGVTFGATATYPAGSIKDANVACHVKRTATGLTADEVRSGTTTPRLALVAVEPIPVPNRAPAAFTPTVSSITATGCTVAFSTTDPDGDSLTYKVAVTTSATPPSDWSGYSDVTSPQAVSGLNAETTYYAHVRAFDGELATVGTSEAFSTTAAGDTTAPTLTGTLTATPTSVQGQVTLAGNVTSNEAVSKWQRQTDGGAWVDVSSTALTFPSTNVGSLAIGDHTFAIRAVDTSGNPSASKTASATVADITNPTIAGTLVATVNGPTQVTLSGPTATDNVGIAKWQRRTNGGAWVDIPDSANNTMPSTAVPDLTPATAYTFEVRPLDAAGNASTAKSASATTQGAAFTDNFNRANSQTIGNGWEQSNDTATSWGIYEYKVGITSQAGSNATLYVSRSASSFTAADISVRLHLVPGAVMSRAYVTMSNQTGSYIGAGYSGYFAFVTGTGIVQIIKRAGGTSTTVGEVTGLTVSDGDEFMLSRRSDGALAAYLNGVEVLARTDTSLSAFASVGLYVAAPSGAVRSEVDDFESVTWS